MVMVPIHGQWVIKYNILKTYCKLFIISFLFLVGKDTSKCMAQYSSTNTQDTAASQAIQVLQNNDVMPAPVAGLAYVDPVKRKAVGDLYNLQMGAIYLLGKAKIPGTAKYLIPYLNYPTADFNPVSIHLGRKHLEDVSKTQSQWPAFSALLETPGASKALTEYALNKENAVNMRFSAFCALRYLDKEQCEVVGKSLSSEFSDSKNTQNYINGVENSQIHFEGAFFSPE